MNFSKTLSAASNGGDLLNVFLNNFYLAGQDDPEEDLNRSCVLGQEYSDSTRNSIAQLSEKDVSVLYIILYNSAAKFSVPVGKKGTNANAAILTRPYRNLTF